MAKRQGSIEALLDRAATDLAAIEDEYQGSLSEQSIGEDLRIDIKNLCGNLRSVLDYLAHEIREELCPGAKAGDRFYFPIFPDRSQFDAQVERWYPGLRAAREELWDYLESVQPYNRGFEWLGQLNRLNNENKHENLVEQTSIRSERITASTPGGGSVSWNPAGVRFGSGVLIGGVPVDPATQMPVPHPTQTVQRVTWVDFRFDGIEVSALALLRASVRGVGQIASDVLALL